MTSDYRALCAELLNGLDELAHPRYPFPGYTRCAMDRARALLAEPEAEGPTDEELDSFLVDVACQHGNVYYSDPLILARAVLARWGHPTPQPVAVSERPWERDGWCDKQGRCWWTANKPVPLPPTWWMVYIPQSCTDGIMLPANAFPTPEATND